MKSIKQDSIPTYPIFQIGDKVRHITNRKIQLDLFPVSIGLERVNAQFTIIKLNPCTIYTCYAYTSGRCGGYTITGDNQSNWCPAVGEFEKVNV